jgi:hypothetical protein
METPLSKQMARVRAVFVADTSVEQLGGLSGLRFSIK